MSDEADGPGVVSVHAHAFEPDGEWWECCAVCGLAEAAHETTTLPGSPTPWKGLVRAMREAGET